MYVSHTGEDIDGDGFWQGAFGSLQSAYSVPYDALVAEDLQRNLPQFVAPELVTWSPFSQPASD